VRVSFFDISAMVIMGLTVLLVLLLGLPECCKCRRFSPVCTCSKCSNVAGNQGIRLTRDHCFQSDSSVTGVHWRY